MKMEEKSMGGGRTRRYSSFSVCVSLNSVEDGACRVSVSREAERRMVITVEAPTMASY